ncbi:MAG TPA: nuclear transport factor 2 family protein [Candidatus Dormibacteraeota bacterium]|jgi:hypothetical protein|nr:nuclear transport factor 2 family protein [Candidatus Dormibacteraeota bacterium]
MDAPTMLDHGLEIWRGRAVNAWTALFTEETRIESPGMEMRGVAGALGFWSLCQDAFPDNQVEQRALFGSGRFGTLEGIFVGMHQATLHSSIGPIGATGRVIRLPFSSVAECVGDQFLTLRLYCDMLELVMQLGLVSRPSEFRV